MPVTVKPILPKPFNSKALTDLLGKQVALRAQEMRKDAEATTATWEHEVKFVVQMVSPTNAEVYTTDEIYGYVDRGTPPHVIRAKHKGGVLAFASAFAPKTQPRVIGSGPGMRGSVDTFRAEVQHPGTAPREFIKTIAKRWQQKWAKLMQEALNQGAKASGHSM